MMPSPVKRSSVPSCSRMSLPIAAWYWRKTRITSSGSETSAKEVKPRKSRKTTTISRQEWGETLAINRKLHGIQRRIAEGIVDALCVLAETAGGDELRGRLLRLIESQDTILSLLDDMAFEHITKEF